MYILVSILIFIVCILLILLVLVQNSKGGGLSANFSSSNQIMGVRKTNDFLEKATWTLAIFLLALCLTAVMTIPREETSPKSAIEEHVKSTSVPNQMPFPTNTPNEEQETD